MPRRLPIDNPTTEKPIRKPNRDLQQPPQVEIVVADEDATAHQHRG